MADIYPFIDNDFFEESNTLFFSFLSDGKRQIVMGIEYSLKKEGWYEMIFGNLETEQRIDYDKLNNNGDGRKVLRTVGASLPQFFELFPSQTVYIEGATSKHLKFYLSWIAVEKFNDKYTVECFKNGELVAFSANANCDFILISKPILLN